MQLQPTNMYNSKSIYMYMYEVFWGVLLHKLLVRNASLVPRLSPKLEICC